MHTNLLFIFSTQKQFNKLVGKAFVMEISVTAGNCCILMKTAVGFVSSFCLKLFIKMRFLFLSCTVNVAYGKAADISSRYTGRLSGPACVAVNGRTSTIMRTVSETDVNCVHSDLDDLNPWWQVDLGQNYSVSSITIYRRGSKVAFRSCRHFTLPTILLRFI